MAWNYKDELVGQRVSVYTGYGDCEDATVIAVSDSTSNIKVRTDDAEILIGNQWDQ